MTDSVKCFEPKFDRLPFVMISHDMRTVIDLLHALDRAEQSRVRALQRERDELRESMHPLVFHGIDVTKETLEGYDDFHIPLAREDAVALREGAGLLLVFAFLERSLRLICEDLASEYEVQKWVKAHLKGKQGRGKVDGYLAFLTQRNGLSFEPPPSFARLRASERDARNAFAHGDWDLHFFRSQPGDTWRALRPITPLLERIEQAFERLTAV
jgi:hypothetical protein